MNPRNTRMVMVLRGKLGSGPLREETAVVLASCPGPAPRRLSSEPGHTLLHTPPQVSGFVFCSSMENGRPPDPADWAVMDVVNYFRTAGFEEQASAFQEQVSRCRETHDEYSYIFLTAGRGSEEEEDQRAVRDL